MQLSQHSNLTVLLRWSQFSKEDIGRWEHLLIKGWYMVQRSVESLEKIVFF